MRLALICDDPGVACWLDAIAGDAVHELTLAVALTPAMSALLRGRSGIRLTNQWEDLLGSRDFDAALVGGNHPIVLEAIKQLATTGRPLLFLPQADQGSTYIYELGLIRDDNHVSICPALRHRCDPVLVGLREQIHSGGLGRIRLLQMERVFAIGVSSSLIPQILLDRAQLFDLEILRRLIGDYDQVTAIRTGVVPEGLLTQSVKLAGRDLPEATWNAVVGPADSCRLTLHSETEQIRLELDPESGLWIRPESDVHRSPEDRHFPIREFLNKFAASLGELSGSSTSAAARPGAPVDWSELVKAFETVDATHRSVTRRRTIELHFEPMSERAIFKTQMTAIGCGVLIGTFLLCLAYLAVASTIPLPGSVLLVLRTLVFTPLAIFLLLQVLYPLTRPSTAEYTPVGVTDDGPADDSTD